MRNQKWNSLLIVIFLFLAFQLSAQEFNSEAFNEKRLKINRVGMTILGSWAIGNIAVSGISTFQSNGETKAFHQMNVGWNAVNLLIAGWGYYQSLSAPVDLSLIESVQEHESIKRILLFNAGLDLAYIAGGAYLLERSKNSTKNQDRFSGFGKSIILQGGFLFAFDVVMYLIHQNHGNSQLYDLVSDINLNISPAGFSLMLEL